MAFNRARCIGRGHPTQCTTAHRTSAHELQKSSAARYGIPWQPAVVIRSLLDPAGVGDSPRLFSCQKTRRAGPRRGLAGGQAIRASGSRREEWRKSSSGYCYLLRRRALGFCGFRVWQSTPAPEARLCARNGGHSIREGAVLSKPRSCAGALLYSVARACWEMRQLATPTAAPQNPP